MIRYAGKLAVQQRVLPNYRVPFFDLLASVCEGGLSLFTGLPRPNESIATAGELEVAHYRAGRNIHVFSGSFTLYYQYGCIEWLNDWDPAALIVEANSRCLSISSAVKWMHKRGRPALGWGLGSPPLSGAPGQRSGQAFAGFRQRRRLSFLRQFEALIAYSQRGAEEYAALGFPAEKIFIARQRRHFHFLHALQHSTQSLTYFLWGDCKPANDLIIYCAPVLKWIQSRGS
jgi:hypothetical protein